MLHPATHFPSRRTLLSRAICAAMAATIGFALPASTFSAENAATNVVHTPLATADSNRPAVTGEHIQQLIRQLGDSRYSARRAAATEIRQIGAEAFDQLHAATTDSDPEVAASARYLLRQISIRWVQSDDSPTLRTLLRDYDRQNDASRLRRVAELAELAEGEGVAGLCRIARYDRSPVVSRMAALAIIRPKAASATPSRVDPTVVERELAGSSRIAADWLRRYLVQLRDPTASVEYWQKLIDEEVARLEQNADDTSAAIVTGLLWNLAELHRELDNRPALFAVFDRMVTVNLEDVDLTAIEMLNWLTKHEAWDVLDQFLAKYQSQLEQSKRPLYYAAIARAKQGNMELAKELADKASQLDSQATLESFFTAKDLEEHNQFDWAVREYKRSIDDKKISSHEGILSRVYLASLLHDYEKDQEAADLLEPLANAVKNEGQTGQLYAELYRYYRGRLNLNLPKAEALSARLHFYRACQYHAAKDWKREQSELEQAIKFDPTDADVLIAMYRVPEADDQWRENVRQRINDLSRQFQNEIDENPTDPNSYNQWAWLISNTEGDFQKAIRYSHRSLELIPPSAGESAGGSFLDTLGRCYFAAGDVENAIKHQREAIKRVDYMQVMHRQLAQFEKALAERNASGANN